MWEALPDLPAMRSVAVTAWVRSPVKIISAESPGKAAIFFTVMLITSWICPARVREVLQEKLRMTVLYMAIIM